MGRDWIGWLIGKDKGRKRWRKRNGYGAGRSFLGLLHSLKLGWLAVGWMGWFLFLGTNNPGSFNGQDARSCLVHISLRLGGAGMGGQQFSRLPWSGWLSCLSGSMTRWLSPCVMGGMDQSSLFSSFL